ncbi:MAG: N-acyl homoserine lactonase family protein [Boseongicola sp.]|nr:N-acyl homoserine lactonase family protein [Boseongicola sp.]MDD9976379.1 N-acyl homoserine lactonase family protein [Boseongicola sp.]
MSDWEVFAIKYADRSGPRRRKDSFIFDDAHDVPHSIDYFMWLLRKGDRTILVDSGYDAEEGTRRDRPIRLDPGDALRPFGLKPEDIDDLIVTHLHYDHAGGLHLFPKAKLHLQAAEMAYATGPCMCHDTLREPFTADHVCEAVRRVYSGKVIFHKGDGQIDDGVTVHCIGGHSRGLQCVRVKTSAGWLVLASDATHFYENIWSRKPFPIVVDVEDMLRGFDTLERLASSPNLVVPGHDPLVFDYFPTDMSDNILRLDRGPTKDVAR